MDSAAASATSPQETGTLSQQHMALLFCTGAPQQARWRQLNNGGWLGSGRDWRDRSIGSRLTYKPDPQDMRKVNTDKDNQEDHPSRYKDPPGEVEIIEEPENDLSRNHESDA